MSALLFYTALWKIIPHVFKLYLRDELCDGLFEALVLAGPDPVLGPHQEGAVQLSLSRAEK